MKTRIKFEWRGTTTGTLYFIVQAKHKCWFWQTIARELTFEEATEFSKKLLELKDIYL